ncbi:uncharacterized protein LOC143920206 [Arctopsyche grandis]|uniref:uncharacterized protein LOC143920206 n=1 Tax=Arctopsyche grandis TaxID=121162 RepID=UPI00406D82F9
MSVIIRLQNLPWSANAMDIRTFFRGLSIPEGGVHIVGGEQGDAFIAFSTDEDARQGMMNDGGKIKEVQVKLLLSSRSEMHKVIESARQSVSFLQLGQAVLAPMVQQPSMPASISGLLAQNMKSLPMNIPTFPLTQIEPMTVPVETISIIDSDKDSKRNRDSKGFERKSVRSRSKSRDRDKKDRSRDKRDRSRSRDRSRDRDRRRRDRSRSRERRERKRDRKDRSRDRDRNKEISDPRLQRKEIEKKSEPFNDEVNNKPYIPMQQIFNNKAKEGLLGDFPLNNIRVDHSMKSLPPTLPSVGVRGMLPFNSRFNQPVPWAVDAPVMGQVPIVNPINIRMNNVDNNMYPNRFNDNANMDQMQRLQELGERRNPNAFQPDVLPYVPRNAGPRTNYNDGNFNANGSRIPINNYMDNGSSSNDSRNRFNHNISSKGCCIKVQNLLTSTGYGDIRRFFAGNFISNQGLKIINNENGKRSGTAFVKFCKNDGKINSLRKNGELLKGRPVVITPLDDDEFDNAIDSYRPNKESEDSGDEGDSQKSLVIVENNESNEINDVFKILVLEDLPAFAKEHDIMKMFSDYSLLSIIIVVTKDVRKQYMAYVQFVNADDAKAALNNKAKHLIGHKTIKVSPCSEVAFEAVKANQNSLDDDFTERENTQPENEEEYIHENNLPPVSRDPRQRRFDNREDETEGSFNKQPKPYQAVPNHGGNPRFQWRGNSNVNVNLDHIPERDNPVIRRPPIIQNDFNNQPYVETVRSDCAFLKGLPLRTKDRDILDFFSDVGVIPVKTHLMLTIQGQPSGDCFCEFMEPEEAKTALNKNGAMLGGNVVSVELVAKQIVNEALGLIPQDKGFGMRGGFRGRGFPPSRGPPRRMRGGPAPYNTGSRGGGNRYMGPSEPAYNNSTDDSGLDGFGVPGCVLSLENVPFRAGIDEILNFFRDYDITQNEVIRRFSDKGNPTGDVRVNLRSPMEAQRALQQLNKLHIRDRTIHITLM